MSQGQGFELRMMVGKESGAAYGVEVARTDSVEIMSEGITRTAPPRTKASLRGFMARGFWDGEKTFAGDVVAELFYKGHEKLLEAAFGQMVTTVVEAATSWKHTFTPIKALGSLSVEIGRDISTFLYLGTKINTLGLVMNVPELLQVTYGMVAQDELVAEPATTDSFPTEQLPIFHQSVLTIDAAAFDVHEFSMDMNNNLRVDQFKHGSAIIKEPIRNELAAFEGSFSADFEDVVQYNKFVSKTPVALVLTITGPALGANNFEIVATIPRAVYSGETPVVGGAGVIPENHPFIAYLSEDGATPPYKLEITNDVETP